MKEDLRRNYNLVLEVADKLEIIGEKMILIEIVSVLLEQPEINKEQVSYLIKLLVKSDLKRTLKKMSSDLKIEAKKVSMLSAANYG